jgi:hypothetical protein
MAGLIDMAVTPNYSWPVPVATDLVKDGYAAIADLGDAIDATVFGLPSSALSLINATTFGAVSSQSFNDVFSATYDNYVILMDLANQGAQVIRFRYRVSGADNTTSNYAYHTQLCGSGSNAYAATSSSAATSFFLTSSDGVNSENTVNVTTFGPFLSERTGMIGLHNLSAGSGAAPYSGGAIETGFFATTSFTGFSIFPDSGTISGRVKIYGVEN